MSNVVRGNPQNASIIWHGDNSEIVFGDGCRLDGLQIEIYSNVKAVLAANIEVKRTCRCVFYDCAQIAFHENVCFGMDGIEIVVGERSKLSIGRKTYFNKNNLLLLSADSELSIGTYCLFSRDVTIRTYDGHPIFDVNTGKQINRDIKREVFIGDHVWFCQGAMALYGANIGSGSIVGAQSLIKSTFPNNCMIVGKAGDARIIKEDIAWIRDDRGLGIDAIPEDYKKQTIHC